MKEAKDPEIKLFGKMIALPENGKVVQAEIAVVEGGKNDGKISRFDRDNCLEDEKFSKEAEEDYLTADKANEEENEKESNKDCSAGKFGETEPVEEDQNSNAEQSKNPNDLPESDYSSDATPNNEDSTTIEASDDKKDESNATDPQQKTLKKPDKILPCPRCNSMDTKFCYYNNYNVNQPRHFCKSCQRYWTAGGTMRNVPVGAGRRKNKNSASHCRHITISEVLNGTRVDAPNGYHHPGYKPNGTVLSFGPEVPLCDSMASVLELGEKKTPNGFRNGQGMPIPCTVGENGDDCSSGSSVITSNSTADGGKNGPQRPVMQNVNGFPSPVPCLPGVPWPVAWNPALPMPAICPSGLPVQFYPAPYWNCSIPGPWSIPWLSPTTSMANPKSPGSGPQSPLGKHSRDGELIAPSTPEGKQSSEQNKVEGSVLVPKTLRIDDPDEAAKSSIWTTLGIKYDSVNKRGIFNAFRSKCDEKKQSATASPALQANPAAVSRSLKFQEST